MAPAKLTDEQGKAVHQALRTIPGNLNKTEQKALSTLSALVDRATTKGLSPEEAITLKAGLAALAEKHPKAEKQHGLTTIANTVAATPKPAVTEAAPVGGTGSSAQPKANAALGGNAAPVGATAARVDSPREGNQEKDRPRDQATRNGDRPANSPVGVATPGSTSAAITANTASANSKVMLEGRDNQGQNPAVASTPPAAAMPTAGSKASPMAAPHTDIKPTIASTNPAMKVEPPKTTQVPTQAMHIEPPKPQPASPPRAPQVTTAPPPPKAPQAATPPPAPPKPALASSAAMSAKPPAAPAPKAQSCAPNMVNGKMMGMVCH
jgi:hypothetical protein